MSEADAQLDEKGRSRPSQSPFARLVRHCIERVMHAGDQSVPGELDFGIGTMLALLAAPGAFAAIFMADKYGTLLRFLRHQAMLDGYAASLPDEYFFMVLAMVVTGAVAIWKWDALIPDRRDYVNLAPLPIPARHILYANLVAVLLLASVLALDVNAASSVLFPLIVCGSQLSLRYTAVFFGTHLLSVFLASAFSFFSVLATLGLLMAILPSRVFRRCSIYVRCGMVVFLAAVLSTSFLTIHSIQHLSPSSKPLVELLSPVWFLGLCQFLRGVADPAFAPLARTAIIASGIVLILALGSYALCYRRCSTQSYESVTNLSGEGGLIDRWKLHWVSDLFLRSSFERACFRFTLKALFRSENQTLMLGGLTGIGIVLGSQTLYEAALSRSAGALPSRASLSVPLIVSYFLLLGLRFSFDIPATLRANWIFRLTINLDTDECVGLARKIMLAFLIPLLLLFCLPAYGLRWGWGLAVIHTAIVAAVCVLLVEILLVRFRKIPFTCSAPHFKSNALVSILLYFLGFVVFTSWISTAERWAFEDPLWYLAFAPALAGIWVFLARHRGEMTYLDRRLIFEEPPEVTVEVLDLTFNR
ncbi:MAG: hypothetical protein ACYDCD_05530 [Candidatus Acidiferrales bacterium]